MELNKHKRTYAYSSPSPNKESKTESTSNEWTAEWLESRVDTGEEDSRIRETLSSLSTITSSGNNNFEEGSVSDKLAESRSHSSDLDIISGSDDETNDLRNQNACKTSVVHPELLAEEASHIIFSAVNDSSSSQRQESTDSCKSDLKLNSMSANVDNIENNDNFYKESNVNETSNLEQTQLDLQSDRNTTNEADQNDLSKTLQVKTIDTSENDKASQSLINSVIDNANHEPDSEVLEGVCINNKELPQTVTNTIKNSDELIIKNDSPKSFSINRNGFNKDVANNNAENICRSVKVDNDVQNRGKSSNILNSTIKESNTDEILKSDYDYDSNLNNINEKLYSNEKELDLNSNKQVGKADTGDESKIVGTKKIITSSWDLVSIVKILYKVGEPEPPKVFPEDSEITKEVFILSKGAFCLHPEGNYTILLKENVLHVVEENSAFLSLPLKHAEVSIENEDTLVFDNRLGRSLLMKCDTKENLLKFKSELELCSSKCWQDECINLVHYPLKCHKNIVVIDLGSCSTRAGILMDQPTLPALFFPSVCASNKLTGKHVYGVEALRPEARQNSTISFPLRPSVKIIKHSIDIDKVSGIFKMVFKNLKVDPTNYAVQVCLPRSLSINAQNDLLRVLLEDFHVQSVSMAHQAILTLYAHNVSTGIVVDVGDRMDILPVIDGFIVEPGVTRLPYGGQRLIHHMKHALAAKHISLSNDIDSFVVQYITENLTYIANDYDTETEIAAAYPDTVRKSIDLQAFAKDENCLRQATLDEARFKVPEGLFNPDLWGLDFPGIHKLVQKAIQTSGVDGRKRLAENIYVSGGVTLTPGFVERLRNEVTKLNEPRITPKVYASNYRYHSTYIGACKFARMDVFPQVCVNREEYARDQMSSLKKFMLCV